MAGFFSQVLNRNLRIPFLKSRGSQDRGTLLLLSIYIDKIMDTKLVIVSKAEKS
jgi:hypothetical protein